VSVVYSIKHLDKYMFGGLVGEQKRQVDHNHSHISKFSTF